MDSHPLRHRELGTATRQQSNAATVAMRQQGLAGSCGGEIQMAHQDFGSPRCASVACLMNVTEQSLVDVSLLMSYTIDIVVLPLFIAVN